MAVQDGEHLFPGIVLGGTVESREYEHRNLGTHTYAEQRAAAGQVKYFEERAPDNDGGAYGVGEVKEPLSFRAMQEAFYEIAEFSDFSHVGVAS